MGTDDKPSTPQTTDAAYLESVLSLVERTSDSLRGLDDTTKEMVRSTDHCMKDREESERLTQARIDVLIQSETDFKEKIEERLRELEEQIKKVCALAPRQPKWLWCFRELVGLVEKKPLASVAVILGLLLFAVVLAELGFNITDWIQPP